LFGCEKVDQTSHKVAQPLEGWNNRLEFPPPTFLEDICGVAGPSYFDCSTEQGQFGTSHQWFMLHAGIGCY
jgi:hypothetical protein